MPAPALDYKTLAAAVAGSAAAFRLTLRLEPVYDKVYPPTYEGGSYVTETRVIRRKSGEGEEKVEKLLCVLLDSVQSQANRMELALQRAWQKERIKLPVIVVDLAGLGHPTVKTVSSLQAPHRIADAILRDSLYKGVQFRESEIGKELDTLSPEDANVLLKYCPTALLFGMWDSTYKRGGLGVKFARCLTSEVIGVNAEGGMKAAIRQDPIQIKKKAVEAIYRSDEEFWTLDPKVAKQDKSKKPVKFGDGTPSAIVHGSIPTKLTKGGYTVEYAEQTTVLSLPAIRRLRFPGKGDQAEESAQTYIAALGLLATRLAIDAGHDLRSRCVLAPTSAVQWELLGAPGEPPAHYSLSHDEAITIYRDALAACTTAGLAVHTDAAIPLTPSPKFATLIKESIALWASDLDGSD